ncbi:MAG: ABC transporter permease [Litorilituus sp.]|jgi:putative ABC transport system permease protein|nr:ABC transporter permease [Litorilituus sp.]
MFFQLTSKSLLYRKGSVLLTTVALSISMLVMFGVEHIRDQAKASFASSVSGVDLIVGARSGELNLLLYSVFRMGKPTNNMSWQSYLELSKDPSVSWSFPISLGDSHQGYKVLGTTTEYFKHFSYGTKQPLSFAHGNPFAGIFDIVIGAEIARKLNYQIGDQIILAHGIGRTSFTNHKDNPFRIVGILQATGTPVDQTLHVSLQGLEVLHLPTLARNKFSANTPLQHIKYHELQPKSVTAVMVSLKSRMKTFQFQRKINTAPHEPLMAILPGVALAQLWQTLTVAENTLQLVSALVIISTLFGLSAMLIASIRERRQEIQLLRILGASPFYIYWIIEAEALLITTISTAISLIFLTLGLVFSKTYLLTQYSLSVGVNILSIKTLYTLGILLFLTMLAAFPPSLIAFKEANLKK